MPIALSTYYECKAREADSERLPPPTQRGNALAETIIGLFKTEVIRRRGPWRTIDAVETMEWGDWFNHHRLL